jgi:hypothetical protein
LARHVDGRCAVPRCGGRRYAAQVVKGYGNPGLAPWAQGEAAPSGLAFGDYPVDVFTDVYEVSNF